ncbi:tryptophan synthase subunit alpha [Actinokineospora xionganensis]|uniref:Tryptophan synthase alpha chain n=1 Tax=Actinokineospora xionganensis TaxID=2684470 RepID=A0ABR7L988_9PSEU|nr:tryptophan synthase subunit alpha [Actinokineospora xionganensis]MBC6449118.1 tryptophan synthase subunit alpha [Actinokineospora xionganensis]
MNRFDAVFAQPNRKSFIPFFTLGDPTRDESMRLIRAAVDAGADALELGFPFSDPVTDGPINQRSMRRALASGMSYDACVEMVREIRDVYPTLPIGLLLYYNLLFKRGGKAYAELADAGVDAVVCSDLPIEESGEHVDLLGEHQIGCIQMIAPNTPMERAARLIDGSSAFTYVISRFGTTGPSATFGDDAVSRVGRLRDLSEKPLVVGFGIGRRDQVTDFWDAGANGVIVGSHFSLLVEENLADLAVARAKIDDFVRSVRG